MINIVVRFFDLIKKGEFKFLINGIAKRLLSKNIAFGLKRDLNLLFQNPDALIDISIRPFRNTDKDHFTADLQNDSLIEKKIPNCYVAANTEDIPCFRIWLIGPDQNLKIKEFWGEYFPVLKEDEALYFSDILIAFKSNLFSKRVQIDEVTKINHLWDLFLQNATEIKKDILLIK